MRKIYLLILLSTLFACRKKETPPPEPQPLPVVEVKGTISGTVRHKTAFGETYTISPADVKITLLPANFTTTSANDGRYTFTGLSAGNYTLVFEKSGCGTVLNPDILFKPGDQGSQDATLADLPAFKISGAYVKDTTWFSTQIPGLYYRAFSNETNAGASAVAIISNSGTPVITDLNTYQNYAPVSLLKLKDDYSRFLSYTFLKDTYDYKKGQMLSIRIYPVAAENAAYISPSENRPVYTAFGEAYVQTFTMVIP